MILTFLVCIPTINRFGQIGIYIFSNSYSFFHLESKKTAKLYGYTTCAKSP
jgi:hypothetical protein